MSSHAFTIYTDIDSLMDTRYATYGVLAFDRLNELTVSGFDDLSYYHRLTENTDLCDMVEFRKLYAARTKEIFQVSQPTSILPTIVDMLNECTETGNRPELPEYGGIIINTYPYKLTEEEEAIFISDLLNFSPIPSYATIETVHIETYGINQKFIKDRNIKVLVSYSGGEILSSLSEYHSLELNKLPETTLVVPAISMAENVTVRELFQGEHYGLGPFGFMEVALGMCIDLKFIDGPVFNGVLTKVIQPNEKTEEGYSPSSIPSSD